MRNLLSSKICVPILIVLIAGLIYYECAHPCISGHYTDIWKITYCYDFKGNPYSCGGYYEETFICDCRK